jgi:aminopeptidase N
MQEAERRFEAYLRDRASLEPNLADPVCVMAARRGGAARFDALRGALERAGTPQERRRFLLALGEFRDRKLIDRALALALDPIVPTQDVAILLVRLLHNRAARERAWEFVKRRWAALRRRMPPMLVSRVVEATPMLQTPAYRTDVAAFFRAHPVPTAERALRQALERFALHAELRRRAAPGLRRFLEAHA